MATFLPGRSITTEQPFIEVDPGLSVGRHRFQLVVVDAQGNRSAPAEQIVQVVQSPIPPVVGPGGVVRPDIPIGPIDPIRPIRPVSPPDPGPLRPGPVVSEPIGGIVRPVREPRGPQRPQRPRRGGQR